ncbi:MAG TPA: hypothetical protein DCE23_03555 [Firmicutes bacterium]|nr:hypothetical protein [Bacillota bacterium]
MKYDIEALKRKMLVKYPFFGSVVASIDYKENMGIPTAGTDGKTIYYNPEYLEGLGRDEQTFIFAHEVCHIAFNHILRSEGKDPELWNIATDGVINQFLKKDGLKLAPGGVDMAEAINYDAEQLYEKLLQEKQQKQQQQKQNGQGNSQNQDQNQSQSQSDSSSVESSQEQTQKGDSEHQSQSGSQEQGNSQNEQQSSSESQGGSDEQQSDSKNQSSSGSNSSQNQDQNVQQNQQSSGGSSDSEQQEEQDSSKRDVGHDTHSLWEEAVKKHKEEQSKSSDKKESLLDKILNKQKDKQEETKSELEKKQEELEEMGEKDAFKKNREDKKKQLEELKQAIAKQASTAGTSTNRDIRTIEDIGTAKPLIDWRYVLREAIKYDVDWSYKNASIEDGIVVANLEEQPMPETEILLDTSGSINEVLLKNFLRECKNILQHSRLKVGCFDTEFYGFHEIRTEEDIENMTFEGGGGTDFDVAVNAFSRRVENKIIFTDGEASMPDMSIDAIWIVFGGEKINPKGGKVINITEEQLDKLYSYEIVNETKGRSR